MGIDFVLSLRSCCTHHAFGFSAYRASPGSPFVQGGRFADLSWRRTRPVVAGGGSQYSSFVNKSDGNCVWRSPHCSLDQEDDPPCHIRHHHERHHHHHHQGHTERGFADISCHNRPGVGFSVSAESCLNEIEEHVCCEESFLHNCNCPSVEWEKSKIDLSSARGAVAGVGVPLSLRMLKRKQQGHGKAISGVAEVGNALLKAFSSMVFMMKELQSHSFYIRQQFFKQEIEDILNQVHRDMHASFLWLFQQVFSCTPELMMLLMVLLADFTAFSMYNRLPVAMTVSPSAPSSAIVSVLLGTLDASALPMSRSGKDMQASLEKAVMTSPSVVDTGDQLLDDSGDWIGNGGRSSHTSFTAAGGDDGDFDSSKSFSSMNKALHSVENSLPSELSSMGMAELLSETQILSDESTASDFSSMAAALAYEELNTAVDDLSNSDALFGSSSNGWDQSIQPLGSLQSAGLNYTHLDQHILQNLVAPVTALIEDDNYTCYDRTYLDYQYAISSDSTNPMLLANYAQFLFLVRKDHDRAEELFRRAVLCDPLDGNAISRFASFLWLARRNLAAAGRAYKAAVRADPSNSFHAADYAHFLWNSGQ
eukprot:c22490_g1_i1 orf=319-2097(+)